MPSASPGVKLKLRGAENYDWRRLQNKLIADVPADKRAGGLIALEESDEITGQLLLEACLQDWSGIEADDGTALPFSADAAKEALTNPDYKKFRLSVLSTAQVLSAETAADREAAAKN